MWGCKSLKYKYGGSDRLGWVMLYLLAGVPGAGVAYGVEQVAAGVGPGIGWILRPPRCLCVLVTRPGLMLPAAA